MRTLFVAFAALLGLSVAAHSADIARLEWGAFIVEDDSSNGWDEFKSVSSDDGNSLKLTFSSLDAKADGATMDATAKISGRYELSQPADDGFDRLNATVEGHVIKSSGATARLVVRIAGVEQVIEWPTGTTESGIFKREMEIAVPAGGRLPNPFEVSIEAVAHKDGAADAAYVSVDTVVISAANPKLAAN